MSSSSSSASAAAGKPPTELHPIHAHAAPASQAARHAVPALLAALFLAAFPRLVADPVPTMWTALPVVTALQLVYAFVCLPMAGSTAPATGKTKKPRPGEKKKAGDSSGPNLIVTALLALLLALLVTPVLYAVMVLFGAPLLTHASHTLLCAAHLALLTSFPLFYVHGVDARAWLGLAAGRAPLDECYGAALGAALGAWLGAVPIPLDWDREWQKWPVTILVGVYGGFVLGRLLGGTVLFGKKVF